MYNDVIVNEQNKISFIKAIANEQDTNIHYKEKEMINL